MSAPEDNSLDEHLRGDSELSRRYRELRSDEVPVALDDVILAAARKDIEKSNRTRRWQRWSAPFALAASAVLALSILFRSGAERETLATPQAPPAAASTPQASAAPGSSDRFADAIAPQEMEVRQAAGAQSQPSAPPITAAPTAVLAASGARAESLVPAEPMREMADERLLEKDAPLAIGAANNARSERAVPDTVSKEIAAPPAADSVRLPAPTLEFKKAAGQIDASEVAERWLTEIRKLRAAGRNEDADRQWREFRKSFPEYAVQRSDIARPKP
jgi:hypothetical protein